MCLPSWFVLQSGVGLMVWNTNPRRGATFLSTQPRYICLPQGAGSSLGRVRMVMVARATRLEVKGVRGGGNKVAPAVWRREHPQSGQHPPHGAGRIWKCRATRSCGDYMVASHPSAVSSYVNMSVQTPMSYGYNKSNTVPWVPMNKVLYVSSEQVNA